MIRQSKTLMSCRKVVRFVLVLALVAFSSYIAAANEKGQPKVPVEDRHWQSPPGAAERENPVPATAESIAQGRNLFEKHCVVCHGPEGRGHGVAAAGLDPKPANLAKMAGHHSDGDIAWKIAHGRGPMPAWKESLSQDQIWHLTNFVKSLGGHTHSH